MILSGPMQPIKDFGAEGDSTSYQERPPVSPPEPSAPDPKWAAFQEATEEWRFERYQHDIQTNPDYAQDRDRIKKEGNRI